MSIAENEKTGIRIIARERADYAAHHGDTATGAETLCKREFQYFLADDQDLWDAGLPEKLWNYDRSEMFRVFYEAFVQAYNRIRG